MTTGCSAIISATPRLAPATTITSKHRYTHRHFPKQNLPAGFQNRAPSTLHQPNYTQQQPHLLQSTTTRIISLPCSKHETPPPTPVFHSAAMGVGGILDLEKQFAQYGAYHSDKMNVLIHMLFVWPILFTAFTLAAYTQPLAPQLPVMAALPYHQYMVLNWSFVAAAVYALFYVLLEKKSGSLAAFLVLCCWVGANAVAQHIPYSLGWKIVALSQVVCWSFQFIGHGVFEGRAPALLDNLAQAFLMAPYFVLLEVLHSLFEYEPYAGFTKSVQNKVGVQVAEFRANKAKAKRME